MATGGHVCFPILGSSASGKTLIWEVVNKRGQRLGTVRWFAQWRKYTFSPKAGATFDAGCLEVIRAFLDTRTREHRELVRRPL
jgi:hypothetical protein